MSKWISVKDRLPENGQEVLTWKLDTSCGENDSFDDYHVLTYYKAGTVIDNEMNMEIESPAERVLDWIFNPTSAIIASKDGFYIFEDGWRNVSNCVSHWQPLPEPPEEEGVV